MIYGPHNYQLFADQHLMDHEYAALFMEMGLGKTVITLTVINRLIFERRAVKRVLVISTKRVATSVWPGEIEKFDHLNRLTCSVITGDVKQRLQALKVKAHIYTIGCENTAWLVAQYATAFPFDMVVIDESSKFKNSKSIRFRALKMVRPLIKRIVLLTGTPSPKSLIDLWAQLYLMDRGERLGQKLSLFRRKYFVVDKGNGTMAFSHKLRSERNLLIGADINAKIIADKIKDVCISMKTRDYHELPEEVSNIISLKMGQRLSKQYLDFEREQVLKLFGDTEITAVNATALSSKLLQFCNGAVYDENKNYHVVHDLKLDALEEIIEEANGDPVFVFYWFKHDRERLLARLKKYKVRILNSDGDIADWNKGRITVSLGHPRSIGHGLNLQYGGHVSAWFGQPNWDIELKDQADARFLRPGQTKTVFKHEIIMRDSIELEVMASMESKANVQKLLMKAVKARVERYMNVFS